MSEIIEGKYNVREIAQEYIVMNALGVYDVI